MLAAEGNAYAMRSIVSQSQSLSPECGLAQPPLGPTDGSRRGGCALLAPSRPEPRHAQSGSPRVYRQSRLAPLISGSVLCVYLQPSAWPVDKQSSTLRWKRRRKRR